MRRGRFTLPVKFPASGVAAFGLIVSCILFWWVNLQEQDNEHANFERRAQFQVATVQQGVANAIDALKVVNRLFVTNGTISPDQFQVFTQPLLARYPYVDAFCLSLVVASDERPAFEARMGARFPGFAISDIVDGKRVVAAARERYRVLEYIEPMAGNERIFGLDTLASSAFKDDAFQRAEDSGLPAATGLVRLIKDTGTQRGIRVLMAVYKGGAVPSDVAARRSAFVGNTVAVLRTGDLFEKILAPSGPLDSAGLEIRVYAATWPDESKLVHVVAAGSQRLWGQASWLPGQRPQSHARNFELAGTQWHMLVSAPPAPFFNVHGGALTALLFGLMATLAASTHTRSIRQLNERLLADIKTRAQVERALLGSEDRLSELADLSSDWFWEQDEHFRFISVSTGALGKGVPPADFKLGSTRWDLQVDPDASDWRAHHAQLKARLPFKNYEFKALIDGMPSRWLSASGNPLFDAEGRFTGYRGTAQNISSRKEAEEALRLSRSELRKLGDHQELIREDERRRVARDIHDELGQNLMALRIDLSLMAERPASMVVTKERADAALQQVDTTIKSVRSIMNDLRPAVLDLGLHAAVEWQARQFERRHGIACDLQIDHEEFALDDKHATALFRIVQEALTNIIRHARASQVQIGMQRRDGELFLNIADDGIGLPPDWRNKTEAFGLAGIEERIHALGGQFATSSTPGQGMTVTVSIRI